MSEYTGQRLSPHARAGRTWPAAVLFFAVAAVLVFSMSMHKDLDVDESPFIASGAMLSRHGTLPYRDYHYNHMPTEVLLYALLFKFTSHYLLTARAFQSLCGAGTATTIFAVAHRAFADRPPRVRLGMAWVFGVALLCNPLFTRTSGLSWNHDFPMLACLLAFVALSHGLRSNHPLAWATASGFLLGVGVTTRLTFAPIAAGFGLLIWLYPDLRFRTRVAVCTAFAGGLVLASIPSIWVWWQSPRNAFFGNFLYPKLNTKIHSMQPDERHRPFKLPAIVGYWFKMWFTLPGNGILTVAFVALAGTYLRPNASRPIGRTAEVWAIAAIVDLLIAAGCMPAPPYPQYFYGPTPFMLLAVVLVTADWPALNTRRWVRRTLAGGLAVTVVMALPAYRGIAWLPRPRKWVPEIVHRGGLEVAGHANRGTILTLESVYAIEGGFDVDPRFVTGRFGLRVADLLTESDRRQYLMPSPKQIPEIFAAAPPAGVLVVKGTDGKLDRALTDAAKAHGYQKLVIKTPGSHLHRQAELWVPAGEGH